MSHLLVEPLYAQHEAADLYKQQGLHGADHVTVLLYSFMQATWSLLLRTWSKIMAPYMFGIAPGL